MTEYDEKVVGWQLQESMIFKDTSLAGHEGLGSVEDRLAC